MTLKHCAGFNRGFQVTEVKLCVSHFWTLSSRFKSTGLDGHDVNRLQEEHSKICGLVIIPALQVKYTFTNSL